MPFWTWLVLGAVALATLWWWGSRPVYYHHSTLHEFERPINGFLSQMDTGAVWIAEREGGPGFLQLALVTNKPLEQAVEFGLPDVDWSRTRFDTVIRALQDAGYESALEASASGETKRFLRVRCAGQRPQLSKTILDLLTRAAGALEWSESETYTVHCRGPGPGPQTWRDIHRGLARGPDNHITRLLRRFAERQLGRRHE